MGCRQVSHFKKSRSPLTSLWSIFNKIFQNHLKSSSLKINIKKLYSLSFQTSLEMFIKIRNIVLDNLGFEKSLHILIFS